MLERCTEDEGGGGSVDERVRWILSGYGQGQEWMRKLEEMRERAGYMGEGRAYKRILLKE